MPILTYASAVWWTGKKIHTNYLEKVQRRALRLICAAFRTTPTTALEIEASIPPIKLSLDLEAKRCAIRFNKLSNDNPILQRLPNAWREGKAPSTAPPLPQHKTVGQANNLRKWTKLQQIAKFTSANDERIFPFLIPPWRKTEKDFKGRMYVSDRASKDKAEAAADHMKKIRELSRQSNHLIVYTDGSRRPIHSSKRVGAGVVGYHRGREVFALRMGLGARAEVYDGELAALTIGAHRAVQYARSHNEITHIWFFADNTSAIGTAFDPKPRAGQLYAVNFHSKICTFLEENAARSVNLEWSPGHSDIPGNDRADALAKEGAELASREPGSRSNALRRAKEAVQRAWRKEWRNTPKAGRYAIANRIEPKLKQTFQFAMLRNKREVFGRLVQCRTGHAYIGEYYRKFVPDKATDCPCGEQLQTREHILRDCPQYEDHRHILRAVSRDVSLPEILGSEDGITALAEFIESSGAFTRNGEVYQKKPTPRPEDEPEDYAESDEEVEAEDFG